MAMKKTTIILCLCFAVNAFGQQLPDAQAQKLKAAQAQITQIQLRLEALNLLVQNLLLDSAMELGLNKQQLSNLELSMDDKGNFIFVPKQNEKTVNKK